MAGKFQPFSATLLAGWQVVLKCWIGFSLLECCVAFECESRSRTASREANRLAKETDTVMAVAAVTETASDAVDQGN